MIRRLEINRLSVSWFLLFVIITSMYLVMGAWLVPSLNAEGKVIAKIIPTTIVLVAILKSKALRGVLFNNHFLSGIALLITSLLVVWSVVQMAVFQELTSDVIALHLIRNLLTSIFEEGLFRIILFVGLIHFFRESGRRFWKTTALTSLVFAILHFTIVLQPENSLYGAFTLVIFAFGMGFFLQVIYVVTRNILVPVSIHFLVNYFGTSGQLNSAENIVVKGESHDLASLLFLFVFCAILIGLSALMYRKKAFDKYISAVE